MQIKILRFGGEVNSIDNSIVLFVALNLSAQVEGHQLSKNVDVTIPTSEEEIYKLVSTLQPLVYAYCEKELLWNQQKP